MKLTPEIQNWEAKKFVGMEIDQDELLKVELPIAKLWDRFQKQDTKIPHKLPNNYGLYTLGDDSTSHATYVAATAVSDFGVLPEGCKEFVIEAGLFAIFEFNGGVEALPEASHYIYNDWVPESEYEIRDGFDMEIYSKKYDEKGIIRLAVPIMQKIEV